jgi:hypothetical protein
MRHIILYRGLDFEREELATASCYFTCTNRRPLIKTDDLVIGRYSMLPYYADQVKDMEYVGAKCINTYNNHLYVADLGNYVADLGELTPHTWNSITDIPEQGPFVLKGETNSRKNSWKYDMFAENKTQAIEIHNRLTSDSLLGQQKIYIRQYVPLVKYLDGVNGMPVTKEFRFFVAYRQLLSGGFYWQNYLDDIGHTPSTDEVPKEFLQKVINKVGNQCNFYTIDVGIMENGQPIVIELNDGQQAGLSCIEPQDLYQNLDRVLNTKITF